MMLKRKLALAICTVERDKRYLDLEIMLKSFRAYGPNIPIFIAWKGELHPTGSTFCDVELLAQPEKVNSFGAAFEFLLNEVPAGYDYLICNDDIVFTPDTIDILMNDVEGLEKAIDKVGFVATRANYARPVQQSFGKSDKIVQAEAVSPICAYLSEETAKEIDWPHINWWSDDIMCWDLNKKGYAHFVSRAYVHHIGERTQRSNGETYEQLQFKAFEWIMANRPDFAELLQV